MNKDMTKRGLDGSNQPSNTIQDTLERVQNAYKSQKQKTKKWKKTTIIAAAVGGLALVAAATMTGLYVANKNNLGPVGFYKITFNADGGTISGGTTGVDIYGLKNTQIGTLALPSATKQSMIFGGWCEVQGGKTPIDPTTMITKDVTYYAIWSPASESVEQNIIATDGESQWICDPSTVCSDAPDTQIKMQQIGTTTTRLVDRNQFNFPISIGKNISYLDNDFLNGCSKFNSSITFAEGSELSYIGTGFLEGCTAYAKSLQLPGRVRCISDSFMYGCSAFNYNLQLPNDIGILGDYFLAECSVFNQNFTLPNTLTHVGTYFMHECRSMQSVLTVNTNIEYFVVGDNGLLSTMNSTCPLAKNGVKLSGDSKDEFKAAYSDLSGSIYRKLVVQP